MECSPVGNSVHGILQAGTLEWVAMQSPRGFSCPRDQAPISCDSCTAGGFLITEPPEKPCELTQEAGNISSAAAPQLVPFWLVRTQSLIQILNLSGSQCLILSLPVVLLSTKIWSASLIIQKGTWTSTGKAFSLNLQAGESSAHVSGEGQRGQKPGACI